jgi:catechol 2,3-dioxygenase-like lactoylglutathione lyase family enzyme
MIDHVSVAVTDLGRSAAFYQATLKPLGYKRLVDREATVGFGKSYPEVWLNQRPALLGGSASGAHVCLRAPSAEAVQSFHTAALAHGGQTDGAPGPRQAALTTYFGAFVTDPDGNRLEAACFPSS